MLISKIVNQWCEAGIISRTEIEVYEYGLDLLLYTSINIVTILFSAAIIGKLKESFVLLAVVLPLQSFCGGYHANTHFRCFLIMYIGWIIAIFTAPLLLLLLELF